MPDGNLNNDAQEPEVTEEETVETPEATVEGTFSKKAYCDGCFSIVTWDDPAVEQTVFGNKIVICPECGGAILTANAEIVTE